MKRLYLWLLVIMCSASWRPLLAGDESGEDMDSLLHKVVGHRQGILILDEEGVRINFYASSQFKGSNDINYYRWWDLGPEHLVIGYHDNYPTIDNWAQTFELLDIGYRYEHGKMYVYNFKTGEESVAYDFTLQPGEQFTTPDGVCWKVVDRRTEVLASTFDYHRDYKNEHVVLDMQSLDGTMKDEWVEYIGSLHYPMQNWGRTDILRSRTMFFNFSNDAMKLVYFNFAEDPIYGQYVIMDPSPDANTNLTRDYCITVDNDKVNIAINYYTFFTRHYCYTYRDGNTFDIRSFELGPMRDGDSAGSPSFDITLPYIPSSEDFVIMYDGEVLTSSIKSPLLTSPNGEENGMDCNLFDLSGRRLAAPPARGLYIEDGKVVRQTHQK